MVLGNVVCKNGTKSYTATLQVWNSCICSCILNCLPALAFVKYCVSESDNESSADTSVSTYERSTKKPDFRTPSPDNFFRKKKIKKDNDMNNLDKLAGALITISQQIMTQPAAQTASESRRENIQCNGLRGGKLHGDY